MRRTNQPNQTLSDRPIWLACTAAAALAVSGCAAAPASGNDPAHTDAPAKAAVTSPPADYGDAPDSANAAGARMFAYPGVPAAFPTSTAGPYHRNAQLQYMLGAGISLETSAESTDHLDGTGNLSPATDTADGDSHDDGLSIPTALPHCSAVTLKVAVKAVDAGQTFPQLAYVNVWVDFDHSGSWGQSLSCPTAVVKEWAVQNYPIRIAGPGTHIVELPAMLSWNPSGEMDAWLRVTLSDARTSSANGGGPSGGYALGETEDYLVEAIAAPAPTSTLPGLQVKSTVALPNPGPQDPGYVSVSGVLRETDVVHLGGGPLLPTPGLLVAVVGTGAFGRLSSWGTPSAGAAPVHLQDGPWIAGRDLQLHVLTVPPSPKLTHGMLLSGALRDGTLWLSTWRVATDGTFTALDTRGYGPNVGVTVDGYTLAHRVLVADAQQRRFQVVTPVSSADGLLRLVSWEVDGVSGAIVGKSDSGGIPGLSPERAMSAVYVEGEDGLAGHYAVSFRNASGNLSNSLWTVGDNGFPVLNGLASSGRNLRNTGDVVRSAQAVELQPLAKTGRVAALVRGNGDLELSTWEGLNAAGCQGPLCQQISSLVSESTLDQDPLTPGVQRPAPAVTTNRVLLRDPLHQWNLFNQNPDTVQAIASVRKVMVTLVALDAVEAGEVSLDDIVTVSQAAANVNNSGASVMGLQANEKISLRKLLYGNMMVSAGDATWAISEYVAGNLQNMVVRMNNKALALGMTSTTHCQSGNVFSSVSYSTARDQATLWESAYQHPLFLEFAGQSAQVVCGTLPGNQSICHPLVQPMTKNMSQYPNLQGSKTGGGGGLCPQLPQFNNVPTCSSGGCLAVQAKRLGRPLIALELQPSWLTGARWTDARTLFDFGYLQLMTPDFRGQSVLAGATRDFGVDVVNDTHAVTATLLGDRHLRMCTWVPQVGGGTLSWSGCTSREYNGLPPSALAVRPTQLDMKLLSSVEADGDYLLGSLSGDQLLLQMWRVGARP
jgi:D-alanyl-D-alanine carboxypeptidase